MTIRTAMAGKAGEHQPQAVEQLCCCPESRTDARNRRSLMQCQRRRNIQHLIHIRSRCLRHPPARVCRKRFQITSRSFGIQHPQRKRAFTGAGYSGNPDNLIQRNINADIFQIMDSCASDFYFVRFFVFPHVNTSQISQA